MAHKLPPLRFGYDALEPYMLRRPWNSIMTSITTPTSTT